MSVVAGAVLLDRVLIAADCRLTVYRSGFKQPPEHHDTVLKLFPSGPWSVAGFVGDDVAAAEIMRVLLLQSRNRPVTQQPLQSMVKWHPLRVERWMPRFLRSAYRETGSRLLFAVMLATVAPGIPTVLTKSAASALLSLAAQKQGVVAGPIADMAFQTYNSPKGSAAIPRTCAGHLTVLRAPHFVPERYGVLEFAAIGSGAYATYSGMNETADGMFNGLGMELALFDAAIADFCARGGIATVGGLRPTYVIGCQGVKPVPREVVKRIDLPTEETIEIVPMSPHLWLQRNATRGTEVAIRPPWEILSAPLPKGGSVFGHDYYD